MDMGDLGPYSLPLEGGPSLKSGQGGEMKRLGSLGRSSGYCSGHGDLLWVAQYTPKTG